MVLARRKTHANKVVKKLVTANREPAQEETQAQPNTSLGPLRGPQGSVLDSFGFLLGPAPFLRLPFLTTLLAYVLRRPKAIMLPFFGFLLSRGHGLCKFKYIQDIKRYTRYTHGASGPGRAGWPRRIYPDPPPKKHSRNRGPKTTKC